MARWLSTTSVAIAFGPADLLNRLVVPMERGIDCFHLKSGRTFQVPFECMLVFASNAVPADIVDEAFLRRIPFKTRHADPNEQEFRQLYRQAAEELHLETSEEDVEYLLQRHYRETGRPMRFCHPRDLLRMIANRCEFHGQPPVVTHDEIDHAVERYVSLKTGRTNACTDRQLQRQVASQHIPQLRQTLQARLLHETTDRGQRRRSEHRLAVQFVSPAAFTSQTQSHCRLMDTGTKSVDAKEASLVSQAVVDREDRSGRCDLDGDC